MSEYRVIEGDCRDVLSTLGEGSVRTCITSPPYFGLRDYGADAQIGLEATPDEFVAALVSVFREVRRVLADDGTLWLNLGDSYAGSWGAQSRDPLPQSVERLMLSGNQIAAHPKGQTNTGSIPKGADYKAKDLLGIPWLAAFALRADGWFLRSEVIWAKNNPMPESVTDRPTRAHEQIFLFAKSRRYFYNGDAIREADGGVPSGHKERRIDVAKERGLQDDHRAYHFPWKPGGGRNKRSVWTVNSEPFDGAHFATFPPKLIEPCVLAGSEAGDTVLDPFNGAGTTGLVAIRNGRNYVGIELNPEYAEITRRRLRGVTPPLFTEAA